MLECGQEVHSRFGAEIIERFPQEPPCAAIPQFAVGSPGIAHHEVEGGDVRPDIDSHPRRLIGYLTHFEHGTPGIRG